MKGLTKDYLLQVIEENKRKKYPIILDFNFNNDDIINKLLKLFDVNIDYKATKILSMLRDYKVDIIKKLNIGKKYPMSMDYWLISGWNENEARKQILSITRCETLFNKNDVINYINSEKNPLNINLDNVDYVNNFVDNCCTFETVYTYNSLRALFDKTVDEYYKSHFDCSKQYKNTNIEFYLARGFDEESAKKYISSMQTKRNYSLSGNISLSESEINDIIDDIDKNDANKTKLSMRYWKSIGLNDDDSLQKINESKETVNLSETNEGEHLTSVVKRCGYNVKHIICDYGGRGDINLMVSFLKMKKIDITLEPIVKLLNRTNISDFYVFDGYIKVGDAIILFDFFKNDDVVDYKTIIKKDKTSLGVIAIDYNVIANMLFSDLSPLIEKISKCINDIITLKNDIHIIK